jgi:hypothetical protein
MTTTNNTAEIMANFNDSVDNSKVYTLKELLAILTKVFPRDKKKREPSAYNIYMKEKMSEIKKDNPNMLAKDVMNMAAKEWGNNKTNFISQSLTKESVVVEEVKEEVNEVSEVAEEVKEVKKALKKKK